MSTRFGARRQVVVPQAVVHDLEVPDALARSARRGRRALGEQVVARAGGRRSSRWSACRTAGRRSPSSSSALISAQTLASPGVPPGVRPPKSRCRIRPRCGIEWKRPQLLAGADVEAAHVARRHLLRCGRRPDRAAHHHDVAADDRRRGDRRTASAPPAAPAPASDRRARPRRRSAPACRSPRSRRSGMPSPVPMRIRRSSPSAQ